MRRKERKEKERGLWTTSPTVGTQAKGWSWDLKTRVGVAAGEKWDEPEDHSWGSQTASFCLGLDSVTRGCEQLDGHSLFPHQARGFMAGCGLALASCFGFTPAVPSGHENPLQHMGLPWGPGAQSTLSSVSSAFRG